MNQQYSIKQIVTLIALIVGLPIFIFLTFKIVWTGRLSIDLPDEPLPDGGVYSLEFFNQKDGKQVGDRQPAHDGYSTTLPSGKYEVRITSGENKAETLFVSVPHFFGRTRVESSMSNQSERTKLGRTAASCPLVENSILYSYQCGNRTLYTSTSMTSQQYPRRIEYPGVLGELMSAREYRDGILVLHTKESGHEAYDGDILLTMIEKGKITTTKVLPASFTEKNKGSVYELIVDRRGGDRFAIVTPSVSHALIYGSLNANPAEHSFDISKNPEGKRKITADLFGGSFAIFYSAFSKTDEHSDEKTELNVPTDTTVRLFSADNLIVSDFAERKYAIRYEYAELCGEQRICLQDIQTNLHIFSHSDGSQLLHIREVQDFYSRSDESIVYSQENRVYLLDNSLGKARMIYSSPKYRLSSINPTRGGVLINTFMNNDRIRSTLHTFVLGLDPARQNTFPDDKLPLTNQSYALIQDMDYVGKNVLVTIVLNSAVFNSTTGRLQYDKKDYDQTTANIIQKLRSEGMDESYKIRFILSY